jgi:hypothetical protein
MVIITAGLRRRPDESRLELINRNVGLFREILGSLKSVALADDAIILVVSNPVDILTYLAVKESGLPAERVIGLGTVLDTCRFRSFLAEHFGVAATDVDALILGEHGDSMVPIWSCATIAGVPLKDYPGYSKEAMDALFERTKNSGAEAIRLKGGAGLRRGRVDCAGGERGCAGQASGVARVHLADGRTGNQRGVLLAADARRAQRVSKRSSKSASRMRSAPPCKLRQAFSRRRCRR